MAHHNAPSRKDGNQSKIEKDLEKLGYSVWSTHKLGDGFPDMVVGTMGLNFFWEIKNPDQPPSKRKLTPDEVVWHDRWRGHVGVAETTEEIHEFIQKELSIRNLL